MTTAETAQAQETLTGDYTLDFAHTRVGFWARHAMVSKVRGQFNKFDGSVHLDAENPANSHIELTIKRRASTRVTLTATPTFAATTFSLWRRTPR